MTGRGIDQILPFPCAPDLHEPFLTSAIDYVRLAEDRSGEIDRPVAFEYIWGDALAEIEARGSDFRIINLETGITARGKPEPKGINYRMHPQNIGCLTAARVNCCILANNHVGDWGEESLTDTLDCLRRAKIETAGAGRNEREACGPAILEAARGVRLLIFAYAAASSGTPASWAAGGKTPGVNFLADVSISSAERISETIAAQAKPGDLVMVSVHWGENWGYEIPNEQRAFAHALIDHGGADLVFGHSSHHPKAIEVHEGRTIFYGCGDFINDYEGISGKEEFRSDLVLGYFLEIDNDRKCLVKLEMIPFRLEKFRLNRASRDEALWLELRLYRECRRFGHQAVLQDSGMLRLIP